jgi:hypothetical protein
LQVVAFARQQLDLSRLWILVQQCGGSEQVRRRGNGGACKACLYVAVLWSRAGLRRWACSWWYTMRPATDPASQLTASKGWAGLARTLGAPSTMTNASFQLKRLYERYLLPYEEVRARVRAVGRP